MKLEAIQITGNEDEMPLAGLRYIPEGLAKPIGVVLAHGFTSGKYSMDGLAAYLSERGYECVTFDAVGHKLGGTGGEMQRIDQSADNMTQTIRWMRANLAASRIVVIGHSMGAAAAIQAAAREHAYPDDSTVLAGIACLCMGLNPIGGFDSPLGASMLKMRSDYVSGAPARELLSGLGGMLEHAYHLGDLQVLLIAARNDVLLPVKSVEMLAERIGSYAEVRAVNAMHLDAPDKARGVLYNWVEALA